MAELLGTVVGVVSLGLQVCSGLNAYLDGVQGHREETESTRPHCSSMGALVKQIEDVQRRNSASFSGSGGSSPSLQPVLARAQTELSLLNDYLNKVCAEASTPQTTIAQKIEGQKRKLPHPRPGLESPDMPFWTQALAAASDRAKSLVVDDLVLRRQRLKKAALNRLSPEHIDRMNLNGPSVLDRHTDEVLDLLENDGHDVPFGLNTRTHKSCQTIYHRIASMWDESLVVLLADAFYSRGFHEVDAPNARGFTPLMSTRNAGFALWLVQHGASLTSLVPETVGGYTATHAALSSARSRRLQQRRHKIHLQIMAATRSAIGEAPYLDACRCRCSLRGCHPYSILLKEHRRSTRASLQSGDMGTVINELELFLVYVTASLAALEGGHWGRGPLPRDLVSTWLRGSTFAVLPLRHTCGDNRWARYDEEEEVEEILEEDAVELRRLETLLVEFEEAVDDSGSSLTEFMQTLTERDVEGARSLGVYLRVDGCEEKCESKDVDYKIVDESAARMLRHYNDKLDMLIR
ncbi:hypothetical protein CSHISOI_10701 [Colletotrichum shisoi]|uniref:Uncharacterized protein n=1 Tax=Colletotrichum shisoi TaxID=2078593 RepID=A0A5Q4BDF3_9PEZI|nr:hypothetical protein CSHISOI_10701 [Colletotrichum shisoi]